MLKLPNIKYKRTPSLPKTLLMLQNRKLKFLRWERLTRSMNVNNKVIECNMVEIYCFDNKF